MSFEASATDELKAAIISIDGPQIDLSNLSDGVNFFAQDMLLRNHFEISSDKLPLVELYIVSSSLELVANDRFESSLDIDFSIVYEITLEEGRAKGIERARQCIKQVTDRILERQRNGEALTPLYLNGQVQIEITAPQFTDLKPGSCCTAVATARLTLNQIEANNA